MSDSEDINTFEKFMDENTDEIIESNVTSIDPSIINVSNMDIANYTGSEMSEIEKKDYSEIPGYTLAACSSRGVDRCGTVIYIEQFIIINTVDFQTWFAEDLRAPVDIGTKENGEKLKTRKLNNKYKSRNIREESCKKFALNLSSRLLTNDEYLLLGKGIKFIPTPKVSDNTETTDEIQNKIKQKGVKTKSGASVTQGKGKNTTKRSNRGKFQRRKREKFQHINSWKFYRSNRGKFQRCNRGKFQCRKGVKFQCRKRGKIPAMQQRKIPAKKKSENPSTSTVGNSIVATDKNFSAEKGGNSSDATGQNFLAATESYSGIKKATSEDIETLAKRKTQNQMI
ncbi:unnamed protein product [Mytilus coruscus]|uniref:Uncharacterized protein n=1 Tax=Mytilus coruscus TaxID=42192 RepID=A0A6J8AKU7_MYTCO|nr:unnamed protein product [Mytilus coruscus]